MPAKIHLHRKFLYLLSILSNIGIVTGQNTEDYFSREGLSINAYHFNQYDGQYSRSYTFYRKATYCNQELLEFINNENGSFQQLKIEGDKVYNFSTSDCEKSLLYDFGLEVNQVITEGLYEDWSVTAKYDVTIENGEVRKRFDLHHPMHGNTSWIEGIGDIEHSLFPIFPYQESFEGYDVFICAKSGSQILWSNPSQASLCSAYSCVIPVIHVDYSIDGFTLLLDNQTIFGSSYIWDFGDGNLSSDINPSHEYAGPGCYTLQLKVSSDCYDDSVVQINNIPICIGDPWLPDYTIDTLFTFKVYRFSDNLEFIYQDLDLYKTEDGGTSWTKLPVPAGPPGVSRRIRVLKMYDRERGIILCGHYSAESDQKAILVTKDGGLTWEEKATGSYFMLNAELQPDGWAWALGQWNYFRTFDYGDTWEEIVYTGGFQLYNIQFIHDSLLIGRSFTGLQPNGTYHLVKSYDNGLTWEKINIPSYVREWVFFDEMNGYGFRENYGISKTVDGGLTWIRIPLPFNIKAYSFYDLNNGWLTDETELVHYTKDGLVNFEVSNCGRNVFQQLTAFSENQAFAVNGFITFGTVFNARTKLTFDQTNIVLCGEEDVDQDGFPASDDCDDENANINPGAVEITYNGIDDDCDSTSLDDDLDLDGYGFGSDCNDENAQIHPGQEEIIYNGIDDDCDSTSLDDDLDMDGFLFKDDCNDLASDTYPGAFEIPDNGIDEDCDGNDLITMTSFVAASKIYLLPNPTSGITFIQSNTDGSFIIKVLDVTGKLLLIKTETKEVDLTNMSNGLYFIELISLSTGHHSINKMVVNK